MDTKNVIAAISLSAAVIILYSLFFAPAVVEQKDIQNDKNIVSENSSISPLFPLKSKELNSKLFKTKTLNKSL